ncbi:FAD/NAD(P)-binding domain-containing protein, partial [Cryphonectria parasitica EP155]
MTQTDPLRILVVGGGIGGLSASIALRLQGHEVEIFEKSRLHTELGNAMYSAPNCTAALNHLGIHPGEIGGVVYRGAKYLDADCNVLRIGATTDQDRATWLAEWYLVTRADLHESLKRKAVSLGVQIHTASLLTSVDPETATITLADGSTAAGDLVVGADGVYSAARAGVLGREVPLYGTGRCCYRFLIPTADLLADPETKFLADTPGSFVEIMGVDDRRIILYPCSSGTVMNIAAFVPRSEVGEIKRGLTGYDQMGNKARLKEHFNQFGGPVQKMLDKIPEDGARLWDLVQMELQPSVTRQKAILIGDAARPFLPYMGQGAAQAIEDGCALGVVLPLGTTPEEIPHRLELWQRLRMDRAAKIINMTRHRGR